MEFTEQERLIAKKITDDKDISNLISKVMLCSEEHFSSDFVKHKTNEELGEVVRANTLAEQKIQLRWNRLKTLAQTQSSELSTGVPE